MLGIKTRLLRFAKTRLGMFDEPVYFRISPVGYYRCNHACPMCLRMNLGPSDMAKLARQDAGSLTIGEYSRLFADVPRSIRFIDIVGGGEPLLFPHIPELIALIKQRPIHGRLITNGALLSQPVIESLIASGWEQVRVSLHAGSRAAYRRVNGVSDFDRVAANIRALIAARGTRRYPEVTLLFVIQRGNASDIPAFVRLARSLGVDGVQFDSLIPVNPATQPTTTQRRRIARDLARAQRSIRLPNNIADARRLYATHPQWATDKRTGDYFSGRYCALVQENMEMTSDGRISPCCIAPATMSVKTQTLMEIWKTFRPFRRDLASGKFAPFCYEYCNYDLPEI